MLIYRLVTNDIHHCSYRAIWNRPASEGEHLRGSAPLMQPIGCPPRMYMYPHMHANKVHVHPCVCITLTAQLPI